MQNGKISTRIGKITVVAWDLCHNAVGRAMLLADMLARGFRVEIVGARFDRYGGRVWPPLAGSSLPIKSFKGDAFPAHWTLMKEMARQIDGDLLLVSKPRLPSLALAALACRYRPRPLLLDIDDLETAFFARQGPLKQEEIEAFRGSADFNLPFTESWTRLCESLIDDFPTKSTSNELLQEKFGGEIIAHARDERSFDPGRYDRQAIRSSFGYGPKDRVVLFLGTPRRHKGLVDLRDALQRLANPRYKLCIVGGIKDPRLAWKLLRSPPRLVRMLPGIAFSQLPETLMIADAVCLLQDPASPVSGYQVPAKFTDALAMGVPILATPVGPLKSLAERGLLTPVTPENLDSELDRALAQAPLMRRRALELRSVFLDEFSYSANLPRLKKLLREASSRPPALADNTTKLLDYLETTYGRKRRPPPAEGRRPGKASARDLDIVFFWKQNDSGIYGRRQEMLAKYLAHHPAVRRVVHFDAPISLARLAWELRRPTHLSHGRLVVANTLSRAWGLAGPDRRSFVYLLPQTLTDSLPASVAARLGRERFASFVSSCLARSGVRPETAVFFFYPTCFSFRRLVRELSPALIVADLVDDQATFYSQDPARARAVRDNVAEIVTASDLVLANCRRLVDAAAGLGQTAELVPNGVEIEHPQDGAEIPADLASIPQPRIGYTGNLSSRLDRDLLRELARQRPDWQLVLIGSVHLDKSVLDLRGLPNVHFLGVRPYPLVRRYIGNFDVALLPHARNAMTAGMHPLKLPLYLALGVPVVATDIDNLGKFRNHIRVAGSSADFIAAVEQALQQKAAPANSRLNEMLREDSWDRLADRIVKLLQERLRHRP